MVHIGKKQHFWVWMGIDIESNKEYSMCDRCKKYRLNGESITRKYYLERLAEGKIRF